MTVSASITSTTSSRPMVGSSRASSLVEPACLAMLVVDRRVHLGPMGAGDLGRAIGAVVGDDPHCRQRHASGRRSDGQRRRELKLLVAGGDQRRHRDRSRRTAHGRLRAQWPAGHGTGTAGGIGHPAGRPRIETIDQQDECERGEQPRDHQRQRRGGVDHQHIDRSDRERLRAPGVQTTRRGDEHGRRHGHDAEPEQDCRHRPDRPGLGILVVYVGCGSLRTLPCGARRALLDTTHRARTLAGSCRPGLRTTPVRSEYPMSTSSTAPTVSGPRQLQSVEKPSIPGPTLLAIAHRCGHLPPIRSTRCWMLPGVGASWPLRDAAVIATHPFNPSGPDELSGARQCSRTGRAGRRGSAGRVGRPDARPRPRPGFAGAAGALDLRTANSILVQANSAERCGWPARGGAGHPG